MALILTAVLVGQYLLYSRLGLSKLYYKLTVSTPEAFEGDEIEIIEEIENAKPLPLPWIRTEISCSRWLSFAGQISVSDKSPDEQHGLISGIFMLKGNQKCRRVWKVRCEKRGVFFVKDTSVAVSDLFGLAKPSAVIKVNESIRVLPCPADIEAGSLSSDTFIGDMQVQRFVLPDPFMISGAKEYSGREPMNRLHWAQTARTGKLMAYNNEFTTERRFLIILNMQRNYQSDTMKLQTSVLEGQIKAAAFMLDYCCKSRAEAALTANSADRLYLEPAAGYEHTMKALRMLAELRNGCGGHIDDFMEEQDFYGYTDIIFITPFLSGRTAELLSRLTETGKTCTILSTDISETDFCEVRHIPRKYYASMGGED